MLDVLNKAIKLEMQTSSSFLSSWYRKWGHIYSNNVWLIEKKHFRLITTAAIMCSPYHVVYLPKGAGNFDWEEPALGIGWLVQA